MVVFSTVGDLLMMIFVEFEGVGGGLMIVVPVVVGGWSTIRWVCHRRMWAGETGGIGLAFLGGEVEAVMVRDGVNGGGAVDEQVGVLFLPLMRPWFSGIGRIRPTIGRPGEEGRIALALCGGELEAVTVRNGAHGGAVDE